MRKRGRPHCLSIVHSGPGLKAMPTLSAACELRRFYIKQVENREINEFSHMSIEDSRLTSRSKMRYSLR
jgi:hypothetical protein